MMDASFLARIRWTEVVVEMEAVERALLPAFAGSTLRGALGRVLRPGLCDAAVKCEEACAQPSQCRYYSLFEQSRSQAGTGSNIPKPLILGAPVPDELEVLAAGGAVDWPYEQGLPAPGEVLPALRNESELLVEEGARLRFDVGLVGEIGAVVPALTEVLVRYGIGAGGGRLKLRKVWDAGFGGRLLYDSRFPEAKAQPAMERTLEGCLRGEPVKRLRIVFVTPTILKIGKETCFDPETIGRECLKHCLVRAVQVHNALGSGATRLPWLDLPEMGVRVVAHRLFHYVLPRRSFRQGQWMNFDGVVGFVDLEGDLTPAMPFVRAAEVLHFGQKATFGLGKIRAFALA